MPQDPYASAAGIAGRTVLTHLIRTLIGKGVLTKSEAVGALDAAAKELASHGTEVAAGGIGIVETIREGLDKP
jgi:hypothetical protein